MASLICEKLEELGTKYPYAFNLEYIINKVEVINSQKHVENNWLVSLLLSLPINEGYAEIWSIYYDLWKNSFVNPELLFTFSLRIEAVLRGWFGDLKKLLVEAAIWNKNGKEKAVPYKFVEKTQELSNFFIEFKSIKDYLSVDKCLKLNACIITQETLFNTLKNLKNPFYTHKPLSPWQPVCLQYTTVNSKIIINHLLLQQNIKT